MRCKPALKAFDLLALFSFKLGKVTYSKTLFQNKLRMLLEEAMHM